MKLSYMAFLVMVCIWTTSCDRRLTRDKQFCKALEAGDTNRIQQFLITSGNVNQLVRYGYSKKVPQVPPIDVAILYGQSQGVQFLLKQGANPNQPDSMGEVPLGWVIGQTGNEVSQATRMQIQQMLLNAGANLDVKDFTKYGWTPLIHAASIGKSEMVPVLLEAGAKVNGTANDGQTALHLADSPEVAKILIDAGADLTAKTTYGDTPAEYVRKLNRMNVFDFLTNYSARTNEAGR